MMWYVFNADNGRVLIVSTQAERELKVNVGVKMLSNDVDIGPYSAEERSARSKAEG